MLDQRPIEFGDHTHQSNLDRNTVDMDRERGEFVRNAIICQLAVSSLDDEYKEFKMAASDPRR